MKVKAVILLAAVLCACGNQSRTTDEKATDSATAVIMEVSDTIALLSVEDSIVGEDTSNVAQKQFADSFQTTRRDVSNESASRLKTTQAGDSEHIGQTTTVKPTAFIIISKLHQNLSVYDVKEGDTLLLAQYPVCMGKNLGNKQKRGDMRTPESPKGKPFFISQIQDAHTWKHDFGDGRGSILSYGHWFLRLNTPGHSGIGIHGSTNNEETVPGRASEGCIRLRDADIIDLKERFAYVGMPVVVKAEGEE